MVDYCRKELEWGGRRLVLETGKIARQAHGAVVVTYGETTVLCTVVASRSVAPDQDFFPLSVHYQEKTFAAGRIPGGFFKREGKASEKEVLTSRLIDRPIRPLFIDSFKNETQVICTVLSHDLKNDPDIAALIGTSAALTISGLPFLGPIGAARVGRINGQFVLNPLLADLPNSELDLVVAGTESGVLMVESEAKELSEELMLQAVVFGQEQYAPVIRAIIEMAEVCANDPWDFAEGSAERAAGLKKQVYPLVQKDLVAAYALQGKQERVVALNNAKSNLAALADQGFSALEISGAFKSVEKDIVRTQILTTGQRIDGRDTKTVRAIQSEVGILPRVHGSALFTRGETQALVVATLGTGDDEQLIDALEGSHRQSFMLHYNFPPYSTAEVGRMAGPGRREIGHGKLAWRAIRPLLPAKADYPYTLRVVSEITESNGSSSMATVCGTSLALMDAGVPLPRPVAGIAMGLIKEADQFAVLTDILGDEDHLGDMDFKVAGTATGITALQMDIKITSITKEIMHIALQQAYEARQHILGEMAKALDTARDEVAPTAPKVRVMSIPRDKIREVIGSGGKVIKEIVETTGAKIDIEDDGTVRISGVGEETIQKAYDRIYGIVAEPEVGVIYVGTVVKVMEFGAFVNFMGARDGLVHISELAPRRVNKVTDVVNIGDSVKVLVTGQDDRGKIKLSMKQVDQETGEKIAQESLRDAS
jgi:polyribonucleotide nucleotidyltransferase